MRTHLSSTALASLLAAALAACAPGAEKITAPGRLAHDVYFPIQAGPHGGIDCNSCHGTFDTFRQFDCLGCHEQARTDSIHPNNPDYKWESAPCLACHPRGTGEGSAENHARLFPIAVGTKHGLVACTECHVAAEDRKQIACAGCHEQPASAHLHLEVGDYTWESPQCLRCHGDSQVDRIADHTFGVGPGTAHHLEACLVCHPNLRQEKAFAADFKLATCVGCHKRDEVEPAHAAVADYAFEDARCIMCHTTGEAIGVEHERIFPIGAGTKHASATCNDCHANTANRKDVRCTSCHEHAQATSATEHLRVRGYGYTSALCLRCHADSQVDGVLAHLPFRISSGDHARSSCLVCHDQRRTDKPFGAEFKKNQCLSCHRGEHDGRYPNSRCLECHEDGRD